MPPSAPGQPRVRVAEDDEDDEYTALVAAAEQAATLLARRGDPGGRRAVLVAEPAPGADPDGPLAWADVVAVHADTGDAATTGDDLGWYATQEVPLLLRGEL